MAFSGSQLTRLGLSATSRGTVTFLGKTKPAFGTIRFDVDTAPLIDFDVDTHRLIRFDVDAHPAIQLSTDV